jgi:hypothetical protein
VTVGTAGVRAGAAHVAYPDQTLTGRGHRVEVGVAQPAGKHQHEYARQHKENCAAVAPFNSRLLFHVVSLACLIHAVCIRRRRPGTTRGRWSRRCCYRASVGL